MIKQKKSKNFIYIVITVVALGLLFVAFSDVSIEQQVVETPVSVKAQ